MNFLTLSDYLVFITQGALQKILRDNDMKMTDAERMAYGHIYEKLMTDAERMAYGHIYEKLSASFDLDAEIQKSGTDRNPALVRWMAVLTIYYIYQSVPDNEIPERIRLNYEDVIAEIQRVAAGKENSTLQPVTSADGTVRSRSRFYYRPRRTHNPFGI